jgi:hypothetical protein
MSVNIRYPNITGVTEKEQITQIKSYLHQLVEHLNIALPNIGTGEVKEQASSSKTVEVQGGEMSYYELRSLIIQDLQKVENLFDQLTKKVYSDVDIAVTTSLQEAKDSGEFDGPQGIPGDDGYTPVKGKDYFTEAEVTAVAKQAAGNILFTMDDAGNLYYEVEE